MYIGYNENIVNVNILLGASFSCEAAPEGGGYAAGAHVGRRGLVRLDLVYDRSEDHRSKVWGTFPDSYEFYLTP